MYCYSKIADTDEMKAAFSSFFIKHREQFSKDMILDAALIHLLSYIERSSIVLSYDEKDQLIAAANYWTISSSDDVTYDPEGKIMFISSSLIVEHERSSRVFMHGFRDMINHVHGSNPAIHTVVFTARADHDYLNKLYSKFARFAKQVEGLHGNENLYETDLIALMNFLNRLKSKKM